MTVALSKEEEDFVRWMDEVDLEEVNLLEPEVAAPSPDPREHERLSGEKASQLPPPSRGVGWDEG